MSADLRIVDRRRFLELGVGAAGALVLGIQLPACTGDRRGARDGSGGAAPGSAAVPGPSLNAFLAVEPDDGVTVTIPRPEMGQGVRTALAMILAEELGAAWESVRVRQADLDVERYGPQYSGGSNSVRTSWGPLRRAGAAARSMLLEEAAERWGVDAASCRAEAGRVTHLPSGRSYAFGELVEGAADRTPPAEPELKGREEFRIVGRPRRSVDAPAIVTGEIGFGLDVETAGMLYAAIARCPSFGGSVAGFDADPAESLPGVRRVLELDAAEVPPFGANNPKMASGVVVVADTTWAALRARDALRVDWDTGDPVGGEARRGESTASQWREWAQLAEGEGHPVRRDGDVEAALEDAATTVEAVYRVPYLAHTPMEPMNCAAEMRPDGCEIWAPTQNPSSVRVAAEEITGLPPDSIRVHVTRSGGGFGRRFYADYAAEAVWTSRQVGAPVQVVWSREDDVRHGFYRPAGHHRLRAGLDGAGRIVAWRQHLVNAPRGTYLNPDEAPEEAAEISEYDFPAGLVPNLRFEYTGVESAVPRGQWRAVEPSANVFVHEAFVDELAAAAGADPLEFRLRLLESPGDVRYDVERLRRVLRVAAEEAGWGRSLPEGHGMGIAGSYANSSFVAHVAEVSVEPGRGIRIPRFVTAVDCGTAVNPTGIEAQVEGSVVYGLSAALGEEITVRDGRAEQGNFDDYPVLRIDEAPGRFETHIVPSDEPPSGMGEPALPPAAPALVNALHTATGRRFRRLPLDLDGEAA